MNLGAMVQPVPRYARFIDEDWYIWGGSMTRTPRGVCHLLYARWPRHLGHFGWISHSEIGHAVAKHPLGPYKMDGVALPGQGGPNWVTSTTHNPTVMHAGGRFYVYFSSARLIGKIPPTGPSPKAAYWEPTRLSQRIGVAVADQPGGPWKRIDKPLIDVTPGTHDHFMTTNPSVAQRPDGKFLMVYKCMGKDRRVFHGVAVADDPLGPFRKDPEPILTHEKLKFPAEDPYIWHQGDRFRGILKDFRGTYTGHRNSLALFESKDGHDWKLAKHPLVATRDLRWADDATQKLMHLERPQLWLEGGKPAVLFCAADENRKHSFNVHIPLRKELVESHKKENA